MKTYMITARIEVQGYDSVDALMEFGKQLAIDPAYSTMELIDADIMEVN
jgi:hypothetical protein